MKEEDIGYKFGFSAIDMENPYFITLESAIKEVLDKEGYTLVTKNTRSIYLRSIVFYSGKIWIDSSPFGGLIPLRII